MKKFSKKVLVVFLMVISAVGFSAGSSDDDMTSCKMGCKFFYQSCKEMNEVLDMKDQDCEKTMTKCTHVCTEMYNNQM